MPNLFNDAEGALTLFFDLRETIQQKDRHMSLVAKEGWGEDLDEWQGFFSELYTPQEVFYRKNYTAESFLAGKELNNTLQNALTEHQVRLPLYGQERMVFCYYLRLRELTKDFARKLAELIREFSGLYAIESHMQQTHLLCVEYRRSEALVDLRERLDILSWLSSESFPTAFATAMLYSSKIKSTIEEQKKGLVNYLYLLSRQEPVFTQSLGVDRGKLRMIAYNDYYRDEALSCRRMINEIDEWISDQTDPAFVSFMGAVGKDLGSSADSMKHELSSFQRRFGRRPVYPVRVTQFERAHVWGHELRNIESSPVYQQTRNKWIDELVSELEENYKPEDNKELQDLLQKYHFPDLICLRQMLMTNPEQPESLDSRLTAVISDPKYKKEMQKLREALTSKLMAYLQGHILLTESERIRNHKLNDRADLEEKENKAGHYTSIKNCFEKIVGETLFELNAIGETISASTYVQVSESINSAWITSGYNIEDTADVWCCPEIEPYEVAVLRVGMCYDLTDKTALDRLKGSMSD